MAEFAATALSPVCVHEPRVQLIGHRAYWHREPYRGGLFRLSTFACAATAAASIRRHDRTAVKRRRLECTSKPGKFLLFTPNPIAGELVHMGSVPGPVFDKPARPQA
jgi:hypothetical protein